MTSDKSCFIVEYFEKWEQDVQRAESLLASGHFTADRQEKALVSQ